MNFANFIELVVECESKLEEIRILLSSYENFEVFTVYKRLDQQRNGQLQRSNIQEFFQDHQKNINKQELSYLIRVLDYDQDGFISFQDFKNIILPKSNDYLRDQALNHQTYELPINMFLPEEVEFQLLKFFEQFQLNYNAYKSKINMIDLNELDIYENIENQISLNSLTCWLKYNNLYVSESILQNFVLLINGSQEKLQQLLDQIYNNQQKEQLNNNIQIPEIIHQQIVQSKEFETTKKINNNQFFILNNKIQKLKELINRNKKQNDNNLSQQQQKYKKNESLYQLLDKEIISQEQNLKQLKQKLSQSMNQIEKPISSPYYVDILLKKELSFSLYNKNKKYHTSNNDLTRLEIKIEKEIMREEIKQKILKTQLQNSKIVYRQPKLTSKYLQSLQKFDSPIKLQHSYIIENYESGEKQFNLNIKNTFDKQPQRLVIPFYEKGVYNY